MGIYNGVIELRNISIKESALDELKLPIQIKYGIINSINIKVPLSKIYYEPVKIIIDGVYIIATEASKSYLKKYGDNAIRRRVF